MVPTRHNAVGKTFRLPMQMRGLRAILTAPQLRAAGSSAPGDSSYAIIRRSGYIKQSRCGLNLKERPAVNIKGFGKTGYV
jgi:hypothetical protein